MMVLVARLVGLNLGITVQIVFPICHKEVLRSKYTKVRARLLKPVEYLNTMLSVHHRCVLVHYIHL